MSTKNTSELWEQLIHETPRAYEAFKLYLCMVPSERSVISTWRFFSDNPDAKNPPGYFQRWVADFAWKDRARAHDAHLDRIRRRGMEQAIEMEAQRLAKNVEKTRNHLLEMLTIGYERAMQKLEEVTLDEMRIQDALQVARLHLDVLKEFGHTEEPREEDVWSAEDDEEFDRILAEIVAEDERRDLEIRTDQEGRLEE